MRIPQSVDALEELGRVRLSQSFYMRDFLYSEIANFYGMPNIPENPDLAIEVGRRLCEELLEPLSANYAFELNVRATSYFRSERTIWLSRTVSPHWLRWQPDALEGDIPGAGEALRHLSERQEAISAEKAGLSAEAMAATIKTPEAEIDALFCDLNYRLARLKEQDVVLHEDFHRFRHQVMSIHSGREHRAELQTITEQAAIDREQIAEFASDLIVKATAKLDPAPGAVQAKPSDTPLLAVIEAYCESQKAEGNWTEKTEAENRAIYAMWLRIVQDQPIGNYDFEQHRRYKSTLQRLPPNLNKDPRYKDKQFEDILALAQCPNVWLLS